MTQIHQYDRDISRAIGPEDSLARLSSWIPWGSKVLEIGPANGYFTKYMATALNCTVDAVELDPQMAESARPFCRKLVVGDLALLHLSDHFAPTSYQVIVLADVIEHLAAPERLIEQLKPLLATGGQMLFSVPNVAYAGLIAGLLDGKFEYRNEGLLDRTHLRFFTRDSLNGFLLAAGLFPREWIPVFRPLNESEFKIRVEAMPTALREVLFASPQALCYQWLVRAGMEQADLPAPELGPCWQDAFPLRAYFANVDEPSVAVAVGVAWGKVGDERQTLEIQVPALRQSQISVALSDRPGYLRLHRVSLYDGDRLLWSWNPQDPHTRLTEHFHGLTFATGADHSLLTLLQSDSWLKLNTEGAPIVSGGVLRFDLGWPMSSDYLTAKAGWEQISDPLAT